MFVYVITYRDYDAETYIDCIFLDENKAKEFLATNDRYSMEKIEVIN